MGRLITTIEGVEGVLRVDDSYRTLVGDEGLVGGIDYVRLRGLIRDGREVVVGELVEVGLAGGRGVLVLGVEAVLRAVGLLFEFPAVYTLPI